MEEIFVYLCFKEGQGRGRFKVGVGPVLQKSWEEVKVV